MSQCYSLPKRSTKAPSSMKSPLTSLFLPYLPMPGLTASTGSAWWLKVIPFTVFFGELIVPKPESYNQLGVLGNVTIHSFKPTLLKT